MLKRLIASILIFLVTFALVLGAAAATGFDTVSESLLGRGAEVRERA